MAIGTKAGGSAISTAAFVVCATLFLSWQPAAHGSVGEGISGAFVLNTDLLFHDSGEGISPAFGLNTALQFHNPGNGFSNEFSLDTRGIRLNVGEGVSNTFALNTVDDNPGGVASGTSVTVAAIWNASARTLAINANAYDRSIGKAITTGSGSFSVADSVNNVVSQSVLLFVHGQWTSGPVSFNRTGQFVVTATINSGTGSQSFNTGKATVVIIGAVTDETGAAVAGAGVTIHDAVSNASVATVQSDSSGAFAFSGAKSVVKGKYVLTATAGIRSGQTNPFSADVSPCTRNIVVADDGAKGLIGEYAALRGLLTSIGKNNNSLIAEMAKSVDYYAGFNGVDEILGAINLASLANDVTDLSGSLGSIDALLRNSSTLTNVTQAQILVQALAKSLSGISGIWGDADFVKDLLTNPRTAQSSRGVLNYFISAKAGGLSFGPAGILPGNSIGNHYDLGDKLANSPFFQKMLDTLNAHQTDFASFLTSSPVSTDFAPDRARGYLRLVQALNNTTAAVGQAYPFWLPETDTSVFLTVMPDYYHYRNDELASNTASVLKAATMVVGEASDLGAGIIGPWGWAAAKAGTTAADWALDKWDCSVKEDFAQTWGLLGGDYLRDLRLLGVVSAETKDFLKSEATSPYYLSGSRRNTFHTETTTPVLTFSWLSCDHVQVGVTETNTSAENCIMGLRCDNYTAVNTSDTPWNLMFNPDIIPALASYSLRRAPAPVAPGTQITYDFDLPTQLQWHQLYWAWGYVKLTSYAGPWPTLSAPYYYLGQQGGKALLRSSEKVLTAEDASGLNSRVALQQRVTLSPASPTANFTYTSAADASKATFQLFDSAGADSCMLVTNASGQRVGFDIQNGTQLAEFPATYSGPVASPEEVQIPQPAGQAYSITITLTEPGIDGVDDITFAILEEPTRPPILGCNPQAITLEACPGAALTILTEVAECGMQVPLDNVHISIGPLVNELGVELPLDTLETPASLSMFHLTAGTSYQALFKYIVPPDAAGTYTGQIQIVTANAGTLTQPVTVNISGAFALATEVSGCGTVSVDPDDVLYEENAVVTLAATACSGWSFDHWEGSVAETSWSSTTAAMDSDKTVMAVFVQDAQSVMVSLTPQNAVLAGAKWRIDGGDWQDDGATVSSVPLGGHTVSFEPIDGWTTPDDQQITVQADGAIQLQGIYARITGSVSVQVTPDTAQWSLLDADGGFYPGTGNQTLTSIPTGTIVITYQPLTGFQAPLPQAQTLIAGAVVAFSGTYAQVQPHPWTGFIEQPIDARAYTGTTCTLTVDVGWYDPGLSYAWWYNTGTLPMQLGGNEPQLVLNSVRASDAGQYWCDVTYGGMTHSSNTATLSVADHLQITQPPQGANVAVGSTYTFAFLTSGGFQPLSYVWKHEGTPVGADSTYTLNILTLRDPGLGAYTVEVSDSNSDVVISDPVQLTTDVGLPVGGLATAAVVALVCALGGVVALAKKRKRL